MWLICAWFGFLCHAGQAAAQDAAVPKAHVIIGMAQVIDGDSIRIGDQQIRLQAIDAPEMDQKCGDAGKEWRCGLAARRRVTEIINNQVVTCLADPSETHDRFGRFLGFCATEDGIAINQEMVRSGYARAFTRYIAGKSHQREFEDAETGARALRRGIWAGTHQAPWDFRAEKRGKSE
jgi:endonuclease YncB( thermonuclease family)